ncbi:MAG: hypothetical protein AAB495_02840 [Patescibacteria group bacterium]
MRRIFFWTVVFSLVLGTTAFATGVATSSKTDPALPDLESNASQDVARVLGNIFSGFFSGAKEDVQDTVKGTSTNAKDLSQPIIEEGVLRGINNWFRGVTGVGFDQFILVFWRLFMWVIRAILGIFQFSIDKLADLLRALVN